MAKKKDDTTNTDGQMGEVLGLLKTVVQKQTEQDERLEELELTGGKAAAELRIIELCYDTDDKHLPGLSRIPLQAVRPFATAMMLSALRDPDVRSGKKSLAECYRTAYLTLMRSVGGEHLGKGRELAIEKVASELEKAQGPEINLGEGT